MKFATVPVEEATGLILAHTTAAFKKGHTLTAQDVKALVQAGIRNVIAAELEAGDIHEDAAAARIGHAARGANCTISIAQTGRVNIHASAAGLVQIDAATVNRLNTLHESITLACLRPFDAVGSRQILATVKIIPFASPDWAVRSAEELLRRQPLSVAAFVPKRVALISTILPGMKLSLLDKTRSVLENRLEALGSTIVDERRVEHDADAITAAIADLKSLSPDIVLIMGASATTDREDSVPAGIIAAGGHIEHFGMPVDPGNLLLLAGLGNMPVIGVPGCARSPKLNGLDFVLQRLCANMKVLPLDIQAMGVGGLLKEITTRPHPRERLSVNVQTPKVEAIVLAAGRSTRMGEKNKLLLPIHGVPMIRRTVEAVLGSGVTGVKVVTGHDADAIRTALEGLKLGFVHNPDFASGMASSLKAGITALSGDADAALVCLGDMPAVTAGDINRLIGAFSPDEARSIIVPTAGGKRGNPVLFDHQFFGEMTTVEGDTGARALLNAYPEAIYEVEMESAAVLADADTPAAFAALQAGLEK